MRSDLAWPRAKPRPPAVCWDTQRPPEQQRQEQAAPDDDVWLRSKQQAAAAAARTRPPPRLDIAVADQWRASAPAHVVKQPPASTPEMERWLEGSTGAGSSIAASHAVLLAAQRARAAGRPLPRVHGLPPPEHVRAAVRKELFQRQFSDRVMKRILFSVIDQQLKEQQRQREGERRGGGGQRRH